MTPKAEAFLADLKALCLQHHVELYAGVDLDVSHVLGIAHLPPGQDPFFYATFEDETDEILPQEELGT